MPPIIPLPRKRRIRVRPGVFREEEVYRELRRVLGKGWPIRFYADRFSRISFLKSRWVLVDTRYFPQVFAEFAERICDKPFGWILYKIGQRVGVSTVSVFVEEGITGQTLIILSFAILARIGWGLFYPTRLLSDRFQIIGHNVFEAESYVQNKFFTEAPICFFTSGVLAGIMSTYYGSPCEIKETKCKAKGDDYCLFEGVVLQNS